MPLGILGFLRIAALLVAPWLLLRLMDFDLDEFVYQVSRLNWIHVAIGAGVLASLFGIPLYRLFREFKIWKLVQEPFEHLEDPFIDVDITEESYGEMYLAADRRIKDVAIFASDKGLTVRKAAYPKLFPTFRIPWKAISNIYFAGMVKNKQFGKDRLGAARVTLAFAEEFILVLPWRERFNGLVPDRIGFQEEMLVAKDA